MQPYPFPISRATLTEGEFSYIDLGDPGAPVILFIHGLGSYAASWWQTLPALAKDYRCIAVDLPGYGLSVSKPFPGGISRYAGLLRQFLQEQDLGPICIAGHSMGAQIAIHMYLQMPALISKLVLLAPAGFETFSEGEKYLLLSMNQPEMMRNFTREQIAQAFEANFKYLRPEMQFMIADRLALMSDAPAYREYSQLVSNNVRSMLEEPVFQLLPRVAVPCLTLFGEDDMLIPNRLLHPVESTRQVARRGSDCLPHNTLYMLPQAGHFLHWDQAARVNALIAAWLKEIGY